MGLQKRLSDSSLELVRLKQSIAAERSDGHDIVLVNLEGVEDVN